MSVNTAHANGGVLIYNGEIILLYCDGVELTIEGGDSKEFGGTKKGRIYLTTHRMIFTNKSEKDNLQSFSFPFFSMAKVELEQPVFGANYIKGLVHAQPGGNWAGKAVFKLKFFSGGAIEFGQAMLKAAKMASAHLPPQPPPYMPHQGPYYPAPPPSYMPPSGGINGFVPPTHAFPDAPPANSVYTSDMPPPYPGIYPPPYVYPPGSQGYPQAGPNNTVVEHPGAGYPNNPPPVGFFPSPGTAPPAYDNGPQAYPGAQPGYPGAQPGYNGAQPGYPGAQPGYPGAQPGYPGAQPGYPSAQAQYPQYNGTAPQAPPAETKSGVPPVYEYFEDPYRPQTMYAQPHYLNGQMNQGPPPPYFPDNSKKEQ